MISYETAVIVHVLGATITAAIVIGPIVYLVAEACVASYAMDRAVRESQGYLDYLDRVAEARRVASPTSARA